MGHVSFDRITITQVISNCFLFCHRRPCTNMRQDGFHFIDNSGWTKTPSHSHTGSSKHFADSINENGIRSHLRPERYGIVVFNNTIREMPVHLVVHHIQFFFILPSSFIFLQHQVTNSFKVLLFKSSSGWILR